MRAVPDAMPIAARPFDDALGDPVSLQSGPHTPRPFDDELHDPAAVLHSVTGSITFAPSKDAPCYDAALVLAQAEVERLREGNRVALGTIARARRWYNEHHGIEYGPERVPPWEVV